MRTSIWRAAQRVFIFAATEALWRTRRRSTVGSFSWQERQTCIDPAGAIAHRCHDCFSISKDKELLLSFHLCLGSEGWTQFPLCAWSIITCWAVLTSLSHFYCRHLELKNFSLRTVFTLSNRLWYVVSDLQQSPCLNLSTGITSVSYQVQILALFELSFLSDMTAATISLYFFFIYNSYFHSFISNLCTSLKTMGFVGAYTCAV